MKSYVCTDCGCRKAATEFRRGGFGRSRRCKGCQKKFGFGGKFIVPRAKVVCR